MVNELFRMFLVWLLVWEVEAWLCRGEVDVVLTAGPGWLRRDCAIVFANNTCLLIHSARVTSVIFTCCDVRKGGKQQKQWAKIS